MARLAFPVIATASGGEAGSNPCCGRLPSWIASALRASQGRQRPDRFLRANASSLRAKGEAIHVVRRLPSWIASALRASQGRQRPDARKLAARQRLVIASRRRSNPRRKAAAVMDCFGPAGLARTAEPPAPPRMRANASSLRAEGEAIHVVRRLSSWIASSLRSSQGRQRPDQLLRANASSLRAEGEAIHVVGRLPFWIAAALGPRNDGMLRCCGPRDDGRLRSPMPRAPCVYIMARPEPARPRSCRF